MDRKHPQGRLAAAVVAVFILLALYVAGYFCCPTEERAIGYDRDVHSVWLARLYAPAVRLESAIVGTPVNLRYRREFSEPPTH